MHHVVHYPDERLYSLAPTPKKRHTTHDDHMRRLIFLLLFVIGLVSAVAAQTVATPLKLTTAAGEHIDVVVNGIMDSSALRLYCIIGSVLGAMLSISVFPMLQWQTAAQKALASTISGAVFTPLLMHWWSLSLTLDYVLGCSATVALCSWSILQIALPMVATAFTKWFGSKTGA